MTMSLKLFAVPNESTDKDDQELDGPKSPSWAPTHHVSAKLSRCFSGVVLLVDDTFPCVLEFLCGLLPGEVVAFPRKDSWLGVTDTFYCARLLISGFVIFHK